MPPLLPPTGDAFALLSCSLPDPAGVAHLCLLRPLAPLPALGGGGGGKEEEEEEVRAAAKMAEGAATQPKSEYVRVRERSEAEEAERSEASAKNGHLRLKRASEACFRSV
jgi:hypothetical protein